MVEMSTCVSADQSKSIQAMPLVPHFWQLDEEAYTCRDDSALL